MPNKSLRLCSNPGCSELTDKAYCAKHTKQYNKQRRSSYKRGYDSRWRKARVVFLRSNPVCVECKKQGWHVPATVVDHIVSHKGDMKLFWDINNWQALCKRHHDIKTAKEDGGFGNRAGGV